MATTLRQKKYAAELVGNGGHRYDAAIAAGYSEAVANSPAQKIERSEGFQEYLKNYAKYDRVFPRLDYLISQNKALPTSLNAIRLAFELRGDLRYGNNVNVNVNQGYQIIVTDEAGNPINTCQSSQTSSGDSPQSEP